ncbi:MAG: hypothetical protein ACRDRL_04415, partial [Sciscionella sp.]
MRTQRAAPAARFPRFVHRARTPASSEVDVHDGTTFRVPVVALLRDAVDSVWPHHRVPRPTQLLTRSLIVTGLGIAAISVAMVVALHLLPGFGGVNPLRGMLSDYALHPDGWAFDWALVLMAIGSAVL